MHDLGLRLIHVLAGPKRRGVRRMFMKSTVHLPAEACATKTALETNIGAGLATDEFSRQWSRLACAQLRAGCSWPLDIPHVFLLDARKRRGSLRRQLNPTLWGSLVAQYAIAKGYRFPCGLLVEDRSALYRGRTCVPDTVFFRSAPTALWTATHEYHGGLVATIPEILRAHAYSITQLIWPVLPGGVELVCHDPYDLCAFAGYGVAEAKTIRSWLARKFLPQHLPPIMNRVREMVLRYCQERTTLPTTVPLRPTRMILH